MNVECIFQAKNILGEGPVWSVDEQALYWVDIKHPLLQRLNPQTGQYTTWKMPSDIGSYALRKSGGAVVALRSGFAFFDFDSGDIVPIIDPEAHLPGNRFNDGKCDRQGRFWAGTMAEADDNPGAAFYRLDADGKCHTMRTGVTISNGLGWSPDNKIMYYTDSPTHNIYAYDFDPSSGTIRNERVFVHDEDGFPDGLTVDAEGYVWSAKWDGWKVVRYAPNGTVDRIIKMPVQCPTSCIFGGPNLTQLFVTSASIDLTEAELAQQPLAGGVFVIETDVKGLPEPKYG
jgi:L-arabinonolactonase